MYHAEAAASERRSVDVKDAVLHRPLLLDRRNAAFVLLANSSRWILPWVAIQLLFTALGRSVIYLLAKLPGYAADEIAAIGLLIFKPPDLNALKTDEVILSSVNRYLILRYGIIKTLC